jgi:hypothetical protein
VAVVHKEGRFAEVDINKAMQTGVGEHVDRLHQQAQEPVHPLQGTMARAPAPQVAEPQLSR